MKTALIIDNDEHSTAIAVETLRRAAFETHCFSSAAEALRAMPSLHPQLHLVEIKLGDGLGFEVTRAIRRHPNLYGAEVLLTSNAVEPRDVEYGLQEGADSFLRKPFTTDDCAERISAMQRLHTQVHEICPITGFSSVYGLRREIDHLIFREENFALCYMIPKGLSQLRQDKEDVRITQAAQTTAQVIRSTLHNDGFYETHCCHLGSGHFMVKTGLDDWKRFYKCVIGRFAAAHAQGKNDSCLPSSTLRFGAAVNREGHRYHRSIDMFHEVRTPRTTSGIEAGVEKSHHSRPSIRVGGHDHWAE